MEKPKSMSSSMPDVHGSADITAEPNLQPRFVIARQALSSSNDTDLCASFSFSKAEQDSRLSSEVKDQTDTHVNRFLPNPSGDDDGRVATEEEVRNLLHVVDNIPVRLWIACLAGILERFVWYGATAPLRAWCILPIQDQI
jgi:POT family proton-dependent oligopeptide transporter